MFDQITQELYEVSSTPQHQLGAMHISKYGDKFRYVKNGGVALAAAHLLQEPAEDTNFRSMVVYADAAIGDTTVSVTLGGTAVTAGMFDNGQLIVESGTGLGQKFRIIKHEIESVTSGVCKFYLDRPIKVALVATTSQVTVRKNPYAAVIEYPVTTQTGGAVGFALTAVPASYYAWVQSGGDTAVLFDTATNTSNNATAIGPSTAVAGSVTPVLDAVGAITIGYAREVVSVDSTIGLAHIMID